MGASPASTCITITSLSWLMGKRIVKLYVFFYERAQLLCLLGNLITLEVRNFKELWKALVEVRHAQDLFNLLANPFVVGNRIGPVRDEEGLEELAESIIKAIEGLEIQPTFNKEGNVIEIVDAKISHHCQSFLAQGFRIVRQPLSFE